MTSPTFAAMGAYFLTDEKGAAKNQAARSPPPCEHLPNAIKLRENHLYEMAFRPLHSKEEP